MLKIYCGGQTLDEICPESLYSQWERVQSRLKAFMKSFKIADISLEENCFF